MRKFIGRLTVTLAMGSLFICANAKAADLDHPWFEVTKTLEDAVQAQRPGDIERILRTKTPGTFWERLDQESKKTTLTKLWGKSINFDENAKAEIVPPAVLDFLFQKYSVIKRDDRIVHAGVEHVYGYLFSNLSTPFGFKRARWVQPDIEKGFGLSTGILNPLTTEGSLLTNVTYFFGKIAFNNDPALQKTLDEDVFVPTALKKFDFKNLKWKRLLEKVSLPGSTISNNKRLIEIRTDFIPFPNEKGANAVLLIYSIFDSAVGTPLLISGFPVAQSFMDGALDPKGLGEKMPVKTRYNAFVENFTTPLTGSREVIFFHE
jgi:hypothetical protein